MSHSGFPSSKTLNSDFRRFGLWPRCNSSIRSYSPLSRAKAHATSARVVSIGHFLVLQQLPISLPPKRIRIGLSTLRRNRDTERLFPIGFSVPGCISEPYGVWLPHVVSEACDLHTLYERIGQDEFAPLRGVTEEAGQCNDLEP